MKNKIFNTVIKCTITVFGNILYAFAVAMFVIPGGLITGGTTGISLAVNYASGFSISAFAFIFNAVMFIAGLCLLGKSFAAATIISTITYPVALELIQQIMGDFVLTRDVLLCTVFGGILIGVSIGIVIRAGASTGGMDIPPLILKKYAGLPVSSTMYVFDFLILVSQIFFVDRERLLYGIILVLIYTFVMDKVLVFGQSKMQIKVISKKSDEIRSAILNHVDRGVTMIDGKTGYTGSNTEIVLSVVAVRELTKLKNVVQDIDPEAFMVINKVNEVRGRGFTIEKRHFKIKNT